MMATMTLTSCSKDDEENIVPTPEEQIVLNCAKPDYLKAGDRVAMISPSYFTPMETIEKAAKVLRSWGFEPVIGPNVDKVQTVNTSTITTTPTPAATRMWLAGKISRSIYEPSCDYH